MTDADRVAFDVAFKSVLRMHGGRDWSEAYKNELRKDYFTALEDLTIEQIEAASAELVRTSPRWPKPLDWRMAVGKLRKPAERPRMVQGEDGSATYFCLRCEDTGWRPACGCDTGRLDLSHRCPAHGPFMAPEPDVEAFAKRAAPGNKHVWKPTGTRRKMALTACECRPRNPAWQANHQTALVEETTR